MKTSLRTSLSHVVARFLGPIPPHRVPGDEPVRSVVSDYRTLAKMAFTAGLAWWLGNLAGQPRPVFAALVPILVMRSDAAVTMRGSLGRVVGVLLGVGLGLVALEIARPSPLAVELTVAVALGDWCLSRNRRNNIVEKGSSQSSEKQIVAYRASCAEAILSVPANT